VEVETVVADAGNIGETLRVRSPFGVEIPGVPGLEGGEKQEGFH
jgi:hypothetical protein